MGGIPWQSLGCNTCRRRKVKCDLSKPKCERCERGRYTCGGYERTRRFVHQSSDKPEIQWRSVFRPAADGNKNDAHENMRERVAAHNTPVVLSRVDITPELRLQFLSLFIDSFLPDPGDGVDRGNVIHSLPSVLGHSQLLDNAITCLCTVFIGITNRDLCLWHDAMSLYCKTLRTMLGSIKNSSKRPTDDILYTAVVLGYYELVNSPMGASSYGWVSHSAGACMLLLYRGCPTKEHPIPTQLYRRLELLSFYVAVGQRKSAHLSDPTWRAASKAIDNQDYFDTLLEILLDCTTLIEYLDRLLQNESYPESFHLGRRLFYHCLVIEERFLTWYDASLQSALDGSVPWPNSSRVSPYLASVDLEKFEACFGDHLDFTSFKIAQAHLLYWTGLVLLYPVMSQLASFCGAEFITGECHEPWEKYTASKNNSRASRDFTDLADHHASQICQSIAYCLQPKFKAIGPQSILSPMWAAQQVFRSQAHLHNKNEWCQAAFGRVSEIGLRFATTLAVLPWSKYPKEQDQKILLN